MSFVEKVRATIEKYGMLEGGSAVAAVSGGIDSMAMLHALYSLREELQLSLVVCHLNHNLRGRESARDLEFVKEASKRLGLRFEGKTLRRGELERMGGSLQEAAREKRLEFLLDTAGKHRARWIAVGHTLDDQAETVIMRFLKGSALHGLGGIPPVRGIFVRPLIEVTRSEVVDFVSRSRTDYVVDSSNLSTEYLRNDIRQRLIPFILENYNPNIIETLGRTAELLRRDEEFIDHIADFLGIVKKTGRAVHMDRRRLLGLHPSLCTRVLLKAAGVLGRRDALYSPHIEESLALIKGPRPNASGELPGPLYLIREYDTVTLTTKAPETGAKFDVKLKVPGETRVPGRCVLRARVIRKMPERVERGATTAYFDHGLLPVPLRARSFRPGDRIIPFGMTGRKKLKEVFIEGKIPLSRRPLVPVVYGGGEVLWVPTLKRSDLFKVTGSTRKVLEIKYLKAR